MRAKEILNNNAIRFPDGNVMPLSIIEWSNDFDPDDSIKANRCLVWLKTVTICLPPRITKNQHLYTDPITIEEKGDTHKEVEDKLLCDIAILSGNTEIDHKFYSAKQKKMINVGGEIFVLLQDQPERRSASYIMLGNGRYTVRFAIAIDLCVLAAGIPACSKCFEKLLKNDYINTNPCKQCTAWGTDVKNSILDFDPSEHYPTECIPDNGKLHPIKLSYDVLKAIKVAYDRILYLDKKKL